MIESNDGEFEVYDKTSQVYDDTRKPIGVEIILGCLAALGRPMDTLTVLDAGCGTGNYSAAIAGHVGALVCLDRNEGMLGRAQEKLGERTDVRFVHSNIDDLQTALPSKEVAFAGIMLNQVAHHFEDPGEEQRFDRLAEFIANAFAVLEPGGVLSINTVSREQLTDGYWWTDLIPEATALVSRRFAPLAKIDELLARAGFGKPRHYVPLDAVLQGAAYFDPRGPLDPTWRAGDSTWALASEEELAAGLARMRSYIEADGGQGFLAEREALRARIGQTTFVVANKPK